MGFDEDLKRRLRRLSAELEAGNEPLRPERAGVRRGVRLRPAAAGIGMAVSIAASVALFAQLLPSNESGAIRPAARSESPSLWPPPELTPEPTPSPPSETPFPPDSYAAPTPSAAPDEPNCGPTPETTDPPDGFRVQISASSTSVARGESIVFTARLTNDGPAAGYEEGSNRAEIFVYDGQGRVVWISSTGLAFTQEIRTGTYQQGESADVTATWEQQGCDDGTGAQPPTVGSGRYTARARWNGNHGGWSPAIPIEIR